jgi:surfeit locus 1 family protein
MAARRFHPSLWSTLAAAAGFTAALSLGFWQLDRAQEKAHLVTAREAAATQAPILLDASLLDAANVENHQVQARGRFDPRGLVLLDNRVRSGQAGYEVVMPLALAGGSQGEPPGRSSLYVLVNRGWVRASGDRTRLPVVTTPDGEVTIVGLAVVPGRKIYELEADTTEGPIWQNLTLDRYRSRKRYAIQPIMIQQTNDTGDGLLREWPTQNRSIDMHRGYAFQWFALAALIAIMYLYFSVRRDPTNP